MPLPGLHGAFPGAGEEGLNLLIALTVHCEASIKRFSAGYLVTTVVSCSSSSLSSSTCSSGSETACDICSTEPRFILSKFFALAMAVSCIPRCMPVFNPRFKPSEKSKKKTAMLLEKYCRIHVILFPAPPWSPGVTACGNERERRAKGRQPVDWRKIKFDGNRLLNYTN